MDFLRSMEFGQPILPAVIGVVSCVISISSMMGYKKFGLSSVLFVTSSACVVCFKKLFEHYRHCNSTPVEENYHEESRSGKIYEESFPFLSFSEKLLDFGKFYVRRHSYPLQLSEKVNYTFLRLKETCDKNYPFYNENTGPDNAFRENQNKVVCMKEKTSKNSDEIRVNLRRCINEIEDSIEHLRLLARKDILELRQQSKGDPKLLSSVKLARPDDKEIYSSKGNVVSPCVTENLVNYSEASKDTNHKIPPSLGKNEKPAKYVENDSTKRFYDFNNSVTLKDQVSSGFNQDTAQLRASQVVKPGTRQHASLTNALHDEQQQKSDILKHKKKLQSSQIEKFSHSGVDSAGSSEHVITTSELKEELKQQPEIYDLQLSTADNQKATVCLRHISKCITSGIILDPSKLEKILEQPEIRHFLLSPSNGDVSWEHSADGTFPSSSDSTTFENYLKDLVSSDDRKKRLESTHLSQSSDSALPSGSMDHGSLDHSSVDLDLTGILGEQDIVSLSKYSSEDIRSTARSISQQCFKSCGIVLDATNHEKYVQQSNNYSLSSAEDDKTAYGSSESIFITEPSGFILYPLQLGKESPGFSVKMEVGVDDKSSGSLQRHSGAINYSSSQVLEIGKGHANTLPKRFGTDIVETGNRPKQKSKSSFFFRIRNSCKFVTKRKKNAKEQKDKY